jgi:hypothetical protein
MKLHQRALRCRQRASKPPSPVVLLPKSHVPEAAYSGTHLRRATFLWRAGRHTRAARARNKGVTTTGLHVWASGVSNLGRVGLVWGISCSGGSLLTAAPR